MDPVSAIGATKAPAVANDSPASSTELAEAAKDFEALILGIMVKSMRSTIEKGDLFGESKHIETYEQLLDQEYAKGMAAQGGMGFAEMILRQYGQGPDGIENLRAATAGLRASSQAYEAYGDAASAAKVPGTGGTR